MALSGSGCLDGKSSQEYPVNELASELEFDLQDTVDQGRKWLVDFNTGKSQLVCFTGLIILVLLM